VETNSHRPMLSRYRRMMAVWSRTPEKWDITANEFRELMVAGGHEFKPLP